MEIPFLELPMKLINIEARDLPDAWFLCIDSILENGYKYLINHGSYAGQYRLEFDYITIHIKYPGTRPLLPDIPTHYGIPNPVADGYLEEYIPYLMTPEKKPGEDYTYGQRLSGFSWLEPVGFEKEVAYNKKTVNQIEEVIKMFKTKGYGTNQAAMSISMPSDILLGDPPCLRHIDCRVKDNKLHFFVYFRSWDLWGGLPANLGGIQMLKEYMAEEIGVEDGEIVAASKGLHLYSYVWELAEARLGRKIK